MSLATRKQINSLNSALVGYVMGKSGPAVRRLIKMSGPWKTDLLDPDPLFDRGFWAGEIVNGLRDNGHIDLDDADLLIEGLSERPRRNPRHYEGSPADLTARGVIGPKAACAPEWPNGWCPRHKDRCPRRASALSPEFKRFLAEQAGKLRDPAYRKRIEEGIARSKSTHQGGNVARKKKRKKKVAKKRRSKKKVAKKRASGSRKKKAGGRKKKAGSRKKKRKVSRNFFGFGEKPTTPPPSAWGF